MRCYRDRYSYHEVNRVVQYCAFKVTKAEVIALMDLVVLKVHADYCAGTVY